MSSTPYLEKMLSSLDDAKQLLKLHEEKIKVATLKPLNWKDKYDEIEIKISCMKSIGEINSIKKVILEKESYFKSYYTQWEKDTAEMSVNFENVFAKCVELSKTNENLKEKIDKIDMNFIETNLEAKVYIYRRLKGLI